MTSTTPTVFQVGDRVIVQSNSGITRLNNRHGVIGSVEYVEETGRYAVDFDLVSDPFSSRAMIPQRHLVKEQQQKQKTSLVVAAVDDKGILCDCSVLSKILNQLACLAAAERSSSPQQQEQVLSVRQKNEWIQKGWKLWEQNPHGIHQELCKLVMNESCCTNAMKDIRAVGGWNDRIVGDFWVVTTDKKSGATYLIPDVNRHAVYKVYSATSSSLAPTVELSFGTTVVLLRVTLLPWYGRLVHDGVITPAHGNPEKPPFLASNVLKEILLDSVQQAEKEGRVVERLAHLETTTTNTTVHDNRNNTKTTTTTTTASTTTTQQQSVWGVFTTTTAQ